MQGIITIQRSDEDVRESEAPQEAAPKSHDYSASTLSHFSPKSSLLARDCTVMRYNEEYSTSRGALAFMKFVLN